MSELTLMILRIGFLLLLWLFIFAIVYALRSDLFGAPVRKLPNNSSTSDGSAGRQTAAPVAATPVSAGAASQGMAPPITPSGGALPSAGASAQAQALLPGPRAGGKGAQTDKTARKGPDNASRIGRASGCL